MKKIFLPIILGKEGKWYVASCPVLDIATQGKTEKEARENIEELIIEYLKDPDTPKPNLETFTFPSLSYIEVSIK
jgi:predicted RNase H-like HicB family nuclease